MEFSKQEYWEWVVNCFLRGFFWPRDWTWVSIAGRFFTIWNTREAGTCKKQRLKYHELECRRQFTHSRTSMWNSLKLGTNLNNYLICYMRVSITEVWFVGKRSMWVWGYCLKDCTQEHSVTIPGHLFDWCLVHVEKIVVTTVGSWSDMRALIQPSYRRKMLKSFTLKFWHSHPRFLSPPKVPYPKM